MPVRVIELAVTVLPMPMFLSAKVAVPETVNESPETLLSEYVTDAAVLAL